jgi:hypothetical protein
MITGEWRRLHNKSFMICTPHQILFVIKSRRMRWAGHVTCMGRGEVHAGFLGADMREGDCLEDPGIAGRITFKWIFKMWYGGHGLY